MLYEKLVCVAALLSPPIYGSTHYVSTLGVKYESNNPYTCPTVTNCNIYCDVGDSKEELEFHCGSSQNCIFYCNLQKCAEKATIYGENANSLTVYGKAKECLKDSVVYAPNSGNAYFYNGNVAEKPYKGMDVYSGTNTQEIIVNCDGTSYGDECKGTNVYASSAHFLQINVGYQKELQEVTIECPADSTYDGPQIAPCVIDATTGYLEDVSIYAPWGWPTGVHITGTSWYKNVKLYCSTVNSLNGNYEGGTSWYPFTETDDCFWTDAPTRSPTKPTRNPTLSPTPSPTSAPTFSPTKAPTFSPTDSPTFSPTKAPTFSPTKAPTRSPTFSPTHAPTQNTSSPTAAPTFSPSAVTLSPTAAPTFSPTLAPTASPTLSWFICPNVDYTVFMECDYIAKVTLVIDWTATDTFCELVSTLDGMRTVGMMITGAIELGLSSHISPGNMFVSSSFRSVAKNGGTVDTIADVATAEGFKIYSLIHDIDASDNMINTMWPHITDAVIAKYGNSSFDVPAMEIGIRLIKPEEVDDEDADNNERNETKNMPTVSIVLIIIGVMFCICLLFCAFCRHKIWNKFKVYFKPKENEEPHWMSNTQRNVQYVEEDSDGDYELDGNRTEITTVMSNFNL